MSKIRLIEWEDARLREAGLSEEEIVEVQAMIGVGLGFSSFYDSLVLDNPA